MSWVLILEDLDSDVREFEAVLRRIGNFDVRPFRAASQAVELLSDSINSGTELPALIVVDLNLPASTGYELLRFYHATPQLKDVPVIVWTVLESETDRKLTRWMGSKKMISKMSGPSTLGKSLMSVLNIQKHVKNRDA